MKAGPASTLKGHIAVKLGRFPSGKELAKVERNREASTDAEYAQKGARIARDDAAKELKRVEHVGSALPEFAIAMRLRR